MKRNLAELRLLSRQLISAISDGKLTEAVIPACVGDEWIRQTCYRQHVSCNRTADLYRVRPMPEAKPATINHGEDLIP